jgi:hypothetical protein
MKRYTKSFFFFIIVIGLSFCAPVERSQTNFPQAIDSVYYRNGVGRQEQTKSGIHFYIKFKKPLSAKISLQSIYFKDQEAVFQGFESNTFTAHFYTSKRNSDLIMHKDSLKEYGNEAPLIKRRRFVLKTNEAILEYKENGKRRLFKIADPIEKPMIASPALQSHKE